MKSLNIHETKTKLSSILKDVEEKKEKFVICKNGKPIADILPHQERKRTDIDPFLSQVKVNCDLIEPLTEELWNIE